MNVLYLNTHDIGRYLQTYGYPVHTPNLLRLSREGMAFTQMCEPDLFTEQRCYVNRPVSA